MKYYALLDPFTRQITLHATRKQLKNELQLYKDTDKLVTFLTINPNRYKVGRVTASYHYPRTRGKG